MATLQEEYVHYRAAWVTEATLLQQ